MHSTCNRDFVGSNPTPGFERTVQSHSRRTSIESFTLPQRCDSVFDVDPSNQGHQYLGETGIRSRKPWAMAHGGQLDRSRTAEADGEVGTPASLGEDSRGNWTEERVQDIAIEDYNANCSFRDGATAERCALDIASISRRSVGRPTRSGPATASPTRLRTPRRSAGRTTGRRRDRGRSRRRRRVHTPPSRLR